MLSERQTGSCPRDRQKTVFMTDRILSLRQTENCPVIRKREKRTIYQKERVRRTALPMETFRMYSCQQKNWRTSGRPSPTGRIISSVYPTWLPPESSTRTMQPPSSAGRCRTIPLPGKNSMKVRSTKHYEKVHRKTDRSPSSQRIAAG